MVKKQIRGICITGLQDQLPEEERKTYLQVMQPVLTFDPHALDLFRDKPLLNFSGNSFGPKLIWAAAPSLDCDL
jgi:hypothetical protein